MDIVGISTAMNLVTSSWAMDDSSVDRLNNWWTCCVLVVCAIIVSMREYVGMPIKCWFPQQFSDAWKQYGENYCWIKNTYFVPPSEELPKDFTQRQEAEIAYYQWVPYVFVCLALMFYVPKIVWRLLNWQNGIHLQSIIGMTNDAGNIEPATRHKTMQTLAKYVEDAILRIEKHDNLFSKLKRMTCWFVTRQKFGTYLTTLYICVKILYVLNIITQFFILNKFLGTSYLFFGWQILRDLSAGIDWFETGHFPRITMCDFSVRALGQKAHNYTVQCVLTINLFNEKVFIFLWFWYVLVAVVTCISLLYWIFNCVIPGRRVAVIIKYLKLSGEYKESYDKAIWDFVTNRLQVDGVLLIRLISENSGDVASTELVKHMWINYKKNSKHISEDNEHRF